MEAKGAPSSISISPTCGKPIVRTKINSTRPSGILTSSLTTGQPPSSNSTTGTTNRVPTAMGQPFKKSKERAQPPNSGRKGPCKLQIFGETKWCSRSWAVLPSLETGSKFWGCGKRMTRMRCLLWRPPTTEGFRQSLDDHLTYFFEIQIVRYQIPLLYDCPFEKRVCSKLLVLLFLDCGPKMRVKINAGRMSMAIRIKSRLNAW